MFFHTDNGSEYEAFVQILDNFNATQSDYYAYAQFFSPDVYMDVLTTSALSGSLPCMADFDVSVMYSLASSNVLIPLDDFLDGDLRNDLLPSVLEQGQYDGIIYSLAVTETGLAIWGDRSVLDQAGVRIPTSVYDTWSLEEFDGALEAIAATGITEYAIEFKLNYGPSWYSFAFVPIVQGFGGDLIDRSSFSASGVLNSPESVSALEWFRSVFDRGLAYLNYYDNDDFVNGRVALSWVGHWEFARYRDALGDRLVLLPMPDFGRGPKTASGGYNWGITSQCPDPYGAWTLLQFMLEPDQIRTMANMTGAIPARMSLLETDGLYMEGGPLRIYAEQLMGGYAVPRPQTPTYAVINDAFAQAVDDILSGQTDVATALDRAAETIDQNFQQ